MKYKIDARGLACPQPVVLTKNKMKEFDEIEIIVDNETARENIKRLASSSGWNYSDAASDDDYTIIITGNINPSSVQDKKIENCINETAVVFSSDKMGKGDDELGAILMKAFIHTLAMNESVPSKIIFYNAGVKLAADGSGVIDDLDNLQSRGTEILICGTCVNYFGLGDKIKTGIISNMYDILDTMNKTAKIINP